MCAPVGHVGAENAAQRLMRVTCVAGSVVVLSTLGVTGEARACEAVGGGPVVGYADGEGLSLGWEVAGSTCIGGSLAHFSLGGSYRPNAPSGLRGIHYLVWEPWLGIGATAGVAIDLHGSGSAVLGAWEAVPFVVAELREQEPDEEVPAIAVTLAIGWRWMSGRHEVYVAPKVFYVRLVDPFT